MLADHGGVPALVRVAEFRDFDKLLVSLDSGIFGSASFAVSAFLSVGWRCFDLRTLDLLWVEVADDPGKEDVEKVKLPSQLKRLKA